MKYINWAIVGLLCFAVSFVSYILSACFMGATSVWLTVFATLEMFAGIICYIINQKIN